MLTSAATLRRALSALLIGCLTALAVLVGVPGTASAAAGWTVERVPGGNAAQTAAAMSQRFTRVADTVVLARDDVYADALAGAPLAASLDAPILLAGPSELPFETWLQLDRLKPQRAVVLGGVAAIGQAVEDELVGMGIAVERVAGLTRFDTAALVAQRLGPADHAFVVLGEHPTPIGGWPDAVAVSGLAAQARQPILLVHHDRVPDITAVALQDMASATVVGGTAAVAEGVVGQLQGHGLDVDRVAGASRFDTSLAIAERALARGASADTVWLTTGGRFADALLAAGPARAANGLVIMVDGPGWATSPARAWLEQRRGQIRHLMIVGPIEWVPEAIGVDLVRQRTGTVQPDIPAGAVRLEVGTDLGAAAAAAEPGTTFVIASGVHRLQQIVPRDGQVFIGETGAVLSGALPLGAGDFHPEGGRFIARGPSLAPTSFDGGALMQPGREGDALPEELWAGERRLQRVTSEPAVDRPGTWHLDYASGRIALFDDPATLGPLELSVAAMAFATGDVAADNVRISHLTITRYASPPSRGAINADQGADWRVSHLTVTQSHGIGVRPGPGMVVESSRLTRMGQLAIGVGDVDATGHRAPLLIQGNEIAFNRELGFQRGWEAGGIKFIGAVDPVIRGNWIHSNHTYGVWFDFDSVGGLVEGNLIEHNAQAGVLYEISVGGVIRDNISRHNGALVNGHYAAGVSVGNSADVQVLDNVLYGNHLPVFAHASDAGVGPFGPRRVERLLVAGNTMRADHLAPGMSVINADTFLYADGGNVFRDNRYELSPVPDRQFFWGQPMTIEQWQGIGQDQQGSFATVTAASAEYSPDAIIPQGATGA